MAHPCNLFITQIRYRDAWIGFFKKRSPLKIFVKRNWKIEKNNKEEVQFQTLQKALEQRVYEERKNFPPKIKKGIHLAAVW